MQAYDLMIGAQVYCLDEKCGRLARVAVDPESWEVQKLIIESGMVNKQARVVPISAVTEASGNEIWLSISAEELAALPEFRETEFRVAPNWEEHLAHLNRSEVPTTAVVISSPTQATPYVTEEKVREGVEDELNLVKRGTTIRNLERELGKLDHVIVDAESGRVTDLIVRHGALMPRRVRLPVAAISDIGEEEIVVETTKDDFDALPEY
jgi:uncharacterized protein YrrD